MEYYRKMTSTPSLRDHILRTIQHGQMRDQHKQYTQLIIQQMRRRREQERRLQLLMDAHVKQFFAPTTMGKRVHHFVAEGDVGECSVCMDPIKKGQNFCLLACSAEHNHSFHKNCILPWFRDHKTCPKCRAVVRS